MRGSHRMVNQRSAMSDVGPATTPPAVRSRLDDVLLGPAADLIPPALAEVGLIVAITESKHRAHSTVGCFAHPPCRFRASGDQVYVIVRVRIDHSVRLAADILATWHINLVTPRIKGVLSRR